MKPNCQDEAAGGKTMEPRIIRVELPPTNAGVTEALRRAFAGAVPRQREGEFDRLLRRLG